jgi:hypothetical protein
LATIEEEMYRGLIEDKEPEEHDKKVSALA